MRYGIYTLFIALWTTACYAAPNFTGIYKCKGFDPYLNKEYSGTIRIIPQNTVYSLEMEYNTGDKAIGTGGLYDDNTIAVVFQNVKDLKKVGLERYSYSQDHLSIQGYWVYLGQDKLGKEVCEKM
ncbi:MAG: hypothetical protein A3E83_08960 [Gammaproteobacteria bacterium RIFCSPHIGHO2_12_FULL_41_20]|nr:MAG: hypothetical protein A3E83_08960 [Gammaproteobacteria bacterium RIFCSPHIGHO2_12_FULL_41_20]